MNLRELAEREDVVPILIATLSRGWTQQYGRRIRLRDAAAVDAGATASQRWYTHPLLGGCFTRGAGPAVRRFLRDGFRFTPVPYRAAAQYIAGTLLCRPSLLTRSARPLFTVSPPLPGAHDLLVFPGNQRIRVYDFRRGIVRVWAKEGFARETMRTEIALRAPGRPGPFFTILESDPGAAWFEEPIALTYALPRCPPWFRRDVLAERAFDQLDAWLEPTRHEAEAEPYAAEVRARIEASLTALDGRPGGPPLATLRTEAERLVAAVTRLGTLSVAHTHGDFQPGNVLVGKRSRVVSLIDWEHARLRSASYDLLVYGLASRWSRGLAERARRFLDSAAPSPPLDRLPADRASREAALAAFWLDELEWVLAECARGPYARITPQVARLLDAHAAFERLA